VKLYSPLVAMAQLAEFIEWQWAAPVPIIFSACLNFKKSINFKLLKNIN